MKSHLNRLLPCLLLLSAVNGTLAREWTSRDGKKIEGEMVELKGESVVLKIKTKKVTIPLNRLSDADAAFAREQASAPANYQIEGKEILPGQRTTVVIDFNDEEKKMARKAKDMPMQARLTFVLHDSFNPKGVNKFFFCRQTHDTKGEEGDTRAIGFFQETAKKHGWSLLVFDSPKGCIGSDTLDMATFAAGKRAMEQIWPGCLEQGIIGAGGISGGAKSSQNLLAIMSKQGLKPKALFLSGCNAFTGNYFKEGYKVSPRILSKVRVFISNGLSDTISTIAHAENVFDEMKKTGGVKEIKMDKYEGGHGPSKASLEKAFTWFDELAEK